MQKTGKTKFGLSVTIDKEVLQRLDNYCKRKFINKSKLLENLIEKHLDGEDNGKST